MGLIWTPQSTSFVSNRREKTLVFHTLVYQRPYSLDYLTFWQDCLICKCFHWCWVLLFASETTFQTSGVKNCKRRNQGCHKWDILIPRSLQHFSVSTQFSWLVSSQVRLLGSSWKQPESEGQLVKWIIPIPALTCPGAARTKPPRSELSGTPVWFTRWGQLPVCCILLPSARHFLRPHLYE